MIPKSFRTCLLGFFAFAFLNASIVAQNAEPSKEKPAKPKTSGASIIYYTYPGIDIKPQSEVATIIVENNLSLSLSGIMTAKWREGGTRAGTSLSIWKFMDVEPGTYEVSATFATDKKSSDKPIVRTMELKADTIYYASFKTSFTGVFNNIQIGRSTWSCNITDNVIPEAKEKVIAARNQDIEATKAKREGAGKFLTGEFGERTTTLSVPQGLSASQVGECVIATMKSRQWEVLSTTDTMAIAQHPNGKIMCYLGVKYNETTVDIYGQDVSKNWSEGYKAVLAKQLKAKANPPAVK